MFALSDRERTMSNCSDTQHAEAEAALVEAQRSGDQAAIAQAEADLHQAKARQDSELTAVLAAVTATI